MNTIALVSAPYYKNINKLIILGIHEYIDKNKLSINFTEYEVSGALEIPSAINILTRKIKPTDAYIAIGCVVKGETSHHNIVGEQSAWGLQFLSVAKKCIIGNAILTVDNLSQALKRADPKQGDKGGYTIKAVLQLLELDKQNNE